MSVILPTTLCLGAAALLINFWLGMRCGKLRGQLKISVGDGGNEQMIRAMRAQSNFVEQVPLTLILLGAVELAGKGGMWLAPLGGLFLLGRVAHALGMGDTFKQGRAIGMLTGMILQLALVVVAVLTALGKM
ncbi:MAG: MAPEG family protein [Novosphingobium sp.]